MRLLFCLSLLLAGGESFAAGGEKETEQAQIIQSFEQVRDGVSVETDTPTIRRAGQASLKDLQALILSIQNNLIENPANCQRFANVTGRLAQEIAATGRFATPPAPKLAIDNTKR